MPRVVPSQVVTLISKMYPFSATQVEGKHERLDYSHSSGLRAVADLVEQIPGELLDGLDPDHFVEFTASLAAIKNALDTWPSRGSTFNQVNLPGFRDLSPVTLIRQALLKCPDEAPSPQTSDLLFIQDADLRENLRLDISTAYRAYANGEWRPGPYSQVR